LANLLYAREIAKNHPQFTTVLIDSGAVKTDLFVPKGGGLLMRLMTSAIQILFLPIFGVTVEEGAKNQLWAATGEGVMSKEYYMPVGVSGKASALSKDLGASEKALGVD
jgi:retinol dehydrogenase 12